MYRLFSIAINWVRHNSIKSSSAGFSLLEMTIVLAIMGVLGGFAFPFLTHQVEQARHKKTREHQKEVIEALETYFAHNNALLCPADPAGTGSPVENKVQGIIPYRALGLPQAIAKDGFGYYMTYAIGIEGEQGAARKASDLSKAVHTPLTIVDETGQNVLVRSENSIACVLISHGSEGTGAYSGSSETARINLAQGSEAEKKNSNEDLNFITRPYSTNPANPFRHRLVWRTYNRLKKIYWDFKPLEPAVGAQRRDPQEKEEEPKQPVTPPSVQENIEPGTERTQVSNAQEGKKKLPKVPHFKKNRKNLKSNDALLKGTLSDNS